MQEIISQVADQLFPENNLTGGPVVDYEGKGFNPKIYRIEFENVASNIDDLSAICHEAAASRGWWHHSVLVDGRYILKFRNVGELIALMHSELSEALEGARKDATSDKIEGFTAVEEELADTLIRLFDFAGAAKLRLGEAFVAKMVYNAQREDHKMENRMAVGGKKI